MDPTQVYAISLGTALVACIAVRGIIYLGKVFRCYSALCAKHFSYPLVVERHRLLGPLSRADLFYYLTYLAVNIFCGTFRVSGIADVGTRAGNLSIINVMPLYLAYHLSLVSDMLGLSLHACRSIHATTGTMSVTLGLIHSVIKIAKVPELKLFRASGQLFGSVVRSMTSGEAAS